MKKIIGIMLMVVMMLLLLSACGIPQEEHDAVVAERDAAKAQVASLQSDLTDAQSQISSLQSEYDEAKSDLSAAQSRASSLQSELTAATSALASHESFKSDLNTLWSEVHKKLTLLETILDYWNDAGKVTSGEISQTEFVSVTTVKFMTKTGTYVDAVGNTELSQLWEDFLTYATLEKEKEMMGSLTALTDLLIASANEDAEAIDVKLSE